MQPNEENAPGGLMAGQVDGNSEESLESATEEEQRQYEALMEPAIGLIHGRENRDNVLNRMKNAQDLGKEIGLIAESIMSLLESQVGGNVSPAARFEVIEEMIMELVSVASESGIASDEEALLGDLYTNGLLTSAAKNGDQTAMKTGGNREQHLEQLKAVMADKGVQQTPIAAKVLENIQAKQR